MITQDCHRDEFEQAVIARMKESGFAEIEIRVECLARDSNGYCDGSVEAYWHFWNAALDSGITESENRQWHNLALQFDRHRMMALAHLRMVVAGQDGALDACREFIAAPPVSGMAITEEVDQLRSEVERLRKNADRYEWLRAQHWSDADVAVVCQPKKSIRLGFDCPSLQRLDDLIDSAMQRSQP